MKTKPEIETRLRIANSQSDAFRLILEPWGREYVVRPKDEFILTPAACCLRHFFVDVFRQLRAVLENIHSATGPAPDFDCAFAEQHFRFGRRGSSER